MAKKQKNNPGLGVVPVTQPLAKVPVPIDANDQRDGFTKHVHSTVSQPIKFGRGIAGHGPKQSSGGHGGGGGGGGSGDGGGGSGGGQRHGGGGGNRRPYQDDDSGGEDSGQNQPASQNEEDTPQPADEEAAEAAELTPEEIAALGLEL